jgi:histone deacetylase 1/2
MYVVLLPFFLQMVIVIFLLSYTKDIYYYSLVAKSNIYSVFHQFQTLADCQFSLKIKSIQTDWGGEYRKLSIFFQTISVHYRLICPHTHEQNDTVERRYRHIVETRLTFLGQCKTSLQFWNYASETSIHLINCMPILVLENRSPFDFLFQWSPDYHFCVLLGVFAFFFCVPITIIN